MYNQNTHSGRSKQKFGFTIPQPVPVGLTKEPWNFKINDKLARTEITKFLFDYAVDNNLQDPLDKRVIIPDNNFQKLFNLKKTDTITFFNIQKHISKLYLKKI